MSIVILFSWSALCLQEPSATTATAQQGFGNASFASCNGERTLSGSQCHVNLSPSTTEEILRIKAPTIPAWFASSPSPEALGTKRVIVILVYFNDVPYSRTATDISNQIFITMNEYYQEVSFGKFSITGDTLAWRQLPRNMAYYGADSAIANDDPNGDGYSESWWLIRDAVQLVDPDVNFSLYDSVMVLHSGYGQGGSRPSNDLVSVHLRGFFFNTNDGVTITRAMIVPEFERSASPLGTYCHEFGHDLGLPDLYHLDHSGEEDFVGVWCLMAYGDWRGPTDFTSYCKIKLGWTACSNIAHVQRGELLTTIIDPLESASDNVTVVKVSLTDTQYYLIEVRQAIGWDMSLPDSGVLITRVNESRGSGDGIVQVIDSTPSTATLDDACFHVGDTYDDPGNNVMISVLATQGDSYEVEVNNGYGAGGAGSVVPLALVGIPIAATVAITIAIFRFRVKRGSA